jgi:hypothetical protein
MVLTAVAVTAALTGCTVAAPTSRLSDYEARAEDIHTELLEQLPDGIGAAADVASSASIDETEPFVPRERQAAHWTTESTVELPSSSAPEAADALGAFLIGENWVAEPTIDDVGGAMPIVDVYRLEEDDGEWMVQVHRDEDAQLLLIVQSPLTVRGSDH